MANITKNLLIKEFDGYSNVVVSSRVYEHMLANNNNNNNINTKIMARPITLKELRSRRDILELSDEVYFRERLIEKYNAKCFDAVVRWFDALSGEGMVELADGMLFPLHFTAIEGINKNNYQWPIDSDREKLEQLAGCACKVVPYISFGYVGIERLRLVD